MTEDFKPNNTHLVSCMDSYKYVSLARATNIRLLHLKPSSSNLSNLHGALNEYSQEDAPQYDCLSYVWGTGDKAARIHIDEDSTIVPITESLHRALLSLRDDSKERVLWVDQICLNQDDVEERNKQVQRMGRIYQRAERDIVWLGDSIGGGDIAIAQLAAALNTWKSFTSSNPSDEWPEGAKMAWLSCGPSDKSPAQWDGFDDIFRTNPVWNRVWIVQEVLLAKEVVLRRGNTDVILSQLWDFVVATTSIVTMAPELMDPMLHLQQLCYNRFRQRRNKRSLEGLLFDYWELGATDERDKIYALLGIARYIDITVDYSKTMSQVQFDTAKALMTQSGTLNLLCFDRCVLEGLFEDQRLPSWVFDFHGFAVPEIWVLSNNDFDGFGLLGGFSAGGIPTPDEKSFNFDAERLETPGLFIDTLEDVQVAFHISEHQRPEKVDAHLDYAWHHALFEYTTNCAQKICHTTQSSLEGYDWSVVSRTLVHDQISTVGRLEEQQMLEGLAQFKLWAAAMSNGHLEEFLQAQSGSKSDFLYSLRTIWGAGNRRLALTKNHKLSVTVGTDAEAGDEICVLKAASVPLLLRKSKNWTDTGTYKQVGTAYVHGIMDGEAWAQTEKFPTKFYRII